MKVLNVSKAIQESDISVKIIKAYENIFAEAICFYFSKSLEKGKFPNCLKLANITPVFKKAHVRQKITIDRLVFSLFLQRYLEGYLVDNF